MCTCLSHISVCRKLFLFGRSCLGDEFEHPKTQLCLFPGMNCSTWILVISCWIFTSFTLPETHSSPPGKVSKMNSSFWDGLVSGQPLSFREGKLPLLQKQAACETAFTRRRCLVWGVFGQILSCKVSTNNAGKSRGAEPRRARVVVDSGWVWMSQEVGING